MKKSAAASPVVYVSAALCALLAALNLSACDAGETSDEPLAQGGATANPARGGTTSVGSGGGGQTTQGGYTSSGMGFTVTSKQGAGTSTQQYQKEDVSRNGTYYKFMANGWGPGFESQSVAWDGGSFTVQSMQGKQGPQYQPASYPTMFYGLYSMERSLEAKLPKAISAMTALNTGWRWSANGNTGQYNAAWDIWLADAAGNFSSFLMVWLRDPPGQQPAGSTKANGLTVPGVQGTWNLWAGTVNGKPCISYVRPEGQDMPEFEFDVLNFIKDAKGRSAQGVMLVGEQVQSVAIGFEIWNGPVTNLVSQDFYVDVK